MIPRLVLALALAVAGSVAIGGVPGTEPVGAAAASPQVQLRARVEVRADGNGVRAERFVAEVTDTTRYALVAHTTPGLASLSVTLNDEVVLSSEAGSPVRIALPDGVVQDGDNRVVLAARGTPGSAARVTIFAVSPIAGAAGGARLLARGATGRGLTASLGSTKGSVRDAMLPEVGDEVL